MSALADKFADEALLLPSNERLELVDKLLKSLNLPTQSDVDQLWAEEAEKRVKEIDEGVVSSISGEEVFNEIRNRLGR